MVGQIYGREHSKGHLTMIYRVTLGVSDMDLLTIIWLFQSSDSAWADENNRSEIANIEKPEK